jgi:hypothetical protein
MPHPPNPLDRARSHAVHLASQFKQIELRAMNGTPPTSAQLNHVSNIMAQLHTHLTQAIMLAEERDRLALNALLTRRPTVHG